jgi:hypothetical protein
VGWFSWSVMKFKGWRFFILKVVEDGSCQNMKNQYYFHVCVWEGAGLYWGL